MVNVGDIVKVGNQTGQVVAVGGREWGEGWVQVKLGTETVEFQESQVSVVSTQVDASCALTPEMIEMAAQAAMANFGKPMDIYDPEAGLWVMRNGEITEYGRTYFQKLSNLGII